MVSVRESALIVATLFGVLFLATADNQMLIPLLPTLGRELGASIGKLSWIFSIYALSAALFNLLLGPLSDRFGRIVFIRLGLLIFFLTALLTYLAETFFQLFWLRALTGLAAGLLSTCSISFIGDFFPYERRGRVMGVVLSSYFAALILGVPMGAWIAQTWSWRNSFLLSALTAFLLFCCSLLFFPRGSHSSSSVNLKDFLRIYPQLLSRRELAAAVVVSFGVSGATLAVITFVSGYLDHSFGLRPLEISWLFVTVGIGAVIASPLAGWLSDRFTKRKIFLIANTLLAIPLLMLDQLSWGIPLVAAFFLISLCIGFRQTALQTLQTELVRTDQRGAFLALRNSCSQLGISVAVFVGGILYSTVGYGAVTILAAVMTLISSGILYRLVEEPKAK